MLRNRKYVLDPSDLQFKQIRLSWKRKLFRFSLWFSGSVLISVCYVLLFIKFFGSPKEKLLNEQVEELKLRYSLIGLQLDDAKDDLKELQISDDIRFRPILDMDTIPESYRKGGYGGIDRFRDLAGYENSDLLISYRSMIEEIKNMVNVQNESYNSITERSVEWKREIDHFPGISPVSTEYPLGDRFSFREVHPVHGTSQWHYGQDFLVPSGTEVYATGDGKIIDAGWSTGGFGYYVIIDHGYGLRTTYAHLSEIKVVEGLNIKRCDLIGLSGSTGDSTGPHLHYEINEYGQHRNPLYYFNDDMNSEEYLEMITLFGSQVKL